jgi:hypothetical protein
MLLRKKGNHMTSLTLSILPGTFTLHRLSPHHPLPDALFASRFLSITQSDDELSIVCDSDIALDSDKQETGWSGLKVDGTLDFALTGILSRLSSILADADISIFALSTYDTDYILVKTAKLQAAATALREAGYVVRG